MSPLNRLLPLCALSLLLVVPSLAQAQSGDQMFAEFRMKDLKFQFLPAGLENRQSSDGEGSAITVQVVRVEVTNYDALDLRHCIDGDSDWCPYSIPSTGNNDGTVTSDELNTFQSLVLIGLRKEVPKVDQLLTILEHNITVDGKTAHGTAKITKAQFNNAVGKVDRNDTILADLDAKVTYDNDPKATKHTIGLGNLALKPDFIYEDVTWTISGNGWKFDTAATAPTGAKQYLTSQGWYSAQGPFEDLTGKGVTMSAVKGGGGKKSPGLDAPLVAVGLALALLVAVQRRR